MSHSCQSYESRQSCESLQSLQSYLIDNEYPDFSRHYIGSTISSLIGAHPDFNPPELFLVEIKNILRSVKSTQSVTQAAQQLTKMCDSLKKMKYPPEIIKRNIKWALKWELSYGEYEVTTHADVQDAYRRVFRDELISDLQRSLNQLKADTDLVQQHLMKINITN
jgi:hypothetical protein